MIDTLTVRCDVCGETKTVSNQGLGRATLAAWRTQHQHLEVTK